MVASNVADARNSDEAHVDFQTKAPKQWTAETPIREGLSFREINEGYTPEQARDEAARCMHCGHCKGCGTCVDDCPGYVLELKHLEERDRPEVAFGDECWHCANCRTSCPCGAIGFSFPLRMQV